MPVGPRMEQEALGDPPIAAVSGADNPAAAGCVPVRTVAKSVLQQALPTQKGEQRQDRQPQDGGMLALDGIEQLDA